MEFDSRPQMPKGPLQKALQNLTEPLRVKALLDTLDNGSPAERLDAARRLARLAERRALPGLLAMLGEDAWIMRVTAAEGLGKLAAADAAPALLNALDDPDQNVTRQALWALSRIAPNIRDEAVRAAFAERLLRLLSDPQTASGGRQTAAWGLTQLTRAGAGAVDLVLPRLLEALESEQKNARWIGAFTLKGINDPRALPALLALLDDPDVTVQAIAAEALEHIASQHPAHAGDTLARLDAWRQAILRGRIDALDVGDPDLDA